MKNGEGEFEKGDQKKKRKMSKKKGKLQFRIVLPSSKVVKTVYEE
jgi:hypothetical protein